jgi:hypothetical protein
MKLALLLALVPMGVAAEPNADIQRALIQRDRQSAEFSRPELRELHIPEHGPLRVDERALQARERDAVPRAQRAPPPAPDYRPLPLPGGLRHGVDPVPVQGLGG